MTALKLPSLLVRVLIRGALLILKPLSERGVVVCCAGQNSNFGAWHGDTLRMGRCVWSKKQSWQQVIIAEATRLAFSISGRYLLSVFRAPCMPFAISSFGSS